MAEVFRDAIRHSAVALVAVHNQPSGDPAPSAADVALTAELLDHIFVGQGRHVSLRQAKSDHFLPVLGRVLEALSASASGA